MLVAIVEGCGVYVSNRCSCMPLTVAFGGNGLGVVVETALTNMVIIGRMVNLPVWEARHLLAMVLRWRRAELALLGVWMRCAGGTTDELAKEPGVVAVSLSGMDIVLVDRRRVVGGGCGVGVVLVVSVLAVVAAWFVFVAVDGFVWGVLSGGVVGRRSFPRRARSCGVDSRRRLCILGLFSAMSC